MAKIQTGKTLKIRDRLVGSAVFSVVAVVDSFAARGTYKN